jgi:hypothetical protein
MLISPNSTCEEGCKKNKKWTSDNWPQKSKSSSMLSPCMVYKYCNRYCVQFSSSYSLWERQFQIHRFQSVRIKKV